MERGNHHYSQRWSCHKCLRQILEYARVLFSIGLMNFKIEVMTIPTSIIYIDSNFDKFRVINLFLL